MSSQCRSSSSGNLRAHLVKLLRVFWHNGLILLATAVAFICSLYETGARWCRYPFQISGIVIISRVGIARAATYCTV